MRHAYYVVGPLFHYRRLSQSKMVVAIGVFSAHESDQVQPDSVNRAAGGLALGAIRYRRRCGRRQLVGVGLTSVESRFSSASPVVLRGCCY